MGPFEGIERGIVAILAGVAIILLGVYDFEPPSRMHFRVPGKEHKPDGTPMIVVGVVVVGLGIYKVFAGRREAREFDDRERRRFR